mmetsp:Transcript_26831/g.68234  ORF Transcript_26831/g.68234 Transcript_26831/m.68234 type:complete len:219 (+) Transcript_26831:2-658(+)
MRVEVGAGREPREEVRAVDDAVELGPRRDHGRGARAQLTIGAIKPAARVKLDVAPAARRDDARLVFGEAPRAAERVQLLQDLREGRLESARGGQRGRFPKGPRRDPPVKVLEWALQRVLPHAAARGEAIRRHLVRRASATGVACERLAPVLVDFTLHVARPRLARDLWVRRLKCRPHARRIDKAAGERTKGALCGIELADHRKRLTHLKKEMSSQCSF